MWTLVTRHLWILIGKPCICLQWQRKDVKVVGRLWGLKIVHGLTEKNGIQGKGKGGGGCMIGDDWVLLFLCTSTPQRDWPVYAGGKKWYTFNFFFFFCWTSSWLITSRCGNWDLGIQSWHCSVWLENASVMTPLVAKNAALYKLSLFLSSSLLLLATKVKSEKPARWDWLSIG